MQTSLITETFDGAFNENVRVQGNVIQDVKLLGKVSKNGRIYSEQALKDAARLYDGVAVYFDHPTESEDRDRGGNRSVRDLAGKVRRPRLVGEEVRGDLQLLELGDNRTSPAAFFRAVAEQMPDAVGMSHSASGVLRPGDGDMDVVESLDAVLSHDLVTNPATTSGLFESITKKPEEGDTMEFKDLTLEGLRQNRPDLVEQVTKSVAESAEIAEVRAEAKRLREENDELKAKDALRAHRAMVTEKLAAAKLPEQLVTDQFREDLESSKDEAEVDRRIAERQAIAKDLTATGPRSIERSLGEDHRTDDVTPLTEDESRAFAPGGSSSLFN